MFEQKQQVLNRYYKQLKPGKKSYNYYRKSDNKRLNITELYKIVMDEINNEGLGSISINTMCRYLPIVSNSDSCEEGEKREEGEKSEIVKIRKKRADIGVSRGKYNIKSGGPNKLNLLVL